MDVRSASRERLRSKNESGTASVSGEGSSTDATDRAKFGSLAGKGLGTAESGAGMPKQQPGEDAATFGERVRKWRAQRKALNGL
jgi:hypothetical protein